MNHKLPAEPTPTDARLAGAADPVRPGRRWLRRVGLAVLATYFVAGAAFLIFRDVIWRDLDRWRPQVEQALESFTGHRVSIQGLSGEFSGFNPAVSADSVRIVGQNGEEYFAADEVTAALNWRSVLYVSPILDVLASRQMRVRIDRISDSEIEVAGRNFQIPDIQAPSPVAAKATGLQRWELPDWLMAHQGFRLEDVVIDYRDRQTGGTLSIEGMSVQSFERNANRSLKVDIPRFSGQEGSIQLRASLNRSLGSPIVLGESLAESGLAPANWHGEAWLRVVDFDVGQIAGLLRRPYLVEKGLVNAQAWFTLANSAPSNARLIVQGREIDLRAAQSIAKFRSADAQVDALWHDNGNVELTLSQAQATDSRGIQVTVDKSSHSLTLTRDFIPVHARFSLQAFDASQFHSFAMGLPIPADMRRRFALLSLDGQVERLRMQFDARQVPTRYNIDAQFEQLSVAYDLPSVQNPPATWSPRLPSAENISGDVQITERDGSAQLSGVNAALSFPGVFQEPRIPFDTLQATVAWTVAPERLPISPAGVRRPDVRVEIQALDFSNADAKGRVSGTFSTATTGPGNIDLTGQLDSAEVSQVHRYLPLKMLPKVRNWMKESFVAGHSDDVEFRIRGDLFDFPFRRPGSGEFLIDAAVQDARFRYAPGWPAIDEMKAQVTIQRGGMKVKASDGKIFDVQLKNTAARIKDFRNAILELSGTASGPAQHMVRYVNRSPIGKRIGGFTARTRISGAAVTDIDLRLPFEDFSQFTVNGSTRVQKARLELTDFLPRATAVTGELQFTEKGIGIERMRARLLGGNASIFASSPQRGVTKIRLAGRVSADGVREFNDSILTRALDGNTAYEANIQVRRGIPSVRVTSRLAGMAVSLPPPLYKRAETQLGLSVSTRPVGDISRGLLADELRVSIPEDRIEAVARRRRTPGGDMRMTRAVLSVGSDQPPVLPAQGLKVSVAGPPINADRWISFWTGEQQLNQGGAQPAVAQAGYFRGFNLVPSEVTLVVPSARFLGRRFNDVVVGASRNDRRWKVSLASDEANGFVEFQGHSDPTKARLFARFKQLNIPQTEFSSFVPTESASAPVLPAMDIETQDFLLRGRPLGRLRLQARNAENAWQIGELSLLQPSARFVASGNWTGRGNKRDGRTQLNFDLDISDAGELLTDVGMPKTLSQGAGKISGDLSWSGTLFAPAVPSLDGALTVAMGQGRFLRSEPGIAKLIGVLNLQALPRRLSLDFSDVFHNGFAFDAIVGQAKIRRGVLSTDSLLMHGVQAEVLIAGSADIRREQQDITVKVAPHINAGIASLAYAALANPAVGIGTLFAQIILDKPLKEIFGHEFKVTGSWAEPTVTQVERYEDDSVEQDSAYPPG